MANIMLNRVSAILAPEQVTTIKAALQQIRDMMPFLIGLSPDERQRIPKMNVANRAFTEDTLHAVTHNPGIFPTYIDGAEMQRDLRLYEELDGLVVLSNQISGLLRDTQMQAGSEAFTAALAAYKMVGAAASGGLPGAKTVYTQLKKRFDGQGNFSAPVTTPAKNPPGA